MSQGWIMLLTLVAQAEAAPASARALDQPQVVYATPQLQPLPAGTSPEVQLTSGIVAPEARGEGRGVSEKNQPLALAPPSIPTARGASQEHAAPTAGTSLTTVVSSLAIVLGLLFGVTWLMRRAGPVGSQPLPSDVVQVLGRAMLSPRQPMQLVRIGDRLVLVANTPAGVQTLTEITDRAEVERLAAACEAARGGSSSATFREVLTQLDSTPAIGGFFGRESTTASARQQTRRSGAEVRHA